MGAVPVPVPNVSTARGNGNGNAGLPRHGCTSLPCFLSRANFLGSAPSGASFIPATHPHRCRVEWQSRPAPLGRRRLGLDGREHGGTLEWHGPRQACQHRPSNDVADATSMCVIVLRCAARCRRRSAARRSVSERSMRSRQIRWQGHRVPESWATSAGVRRISTGTHDGISKQSDRDGSTEFSNDLWLAGVARVRSWRDNDSGQSG